MPTFQILSFCEIDTYIHIMERYIKYFKLDILIKEIFLTKGKNTSINDIGEKEQQGNPDGWLAPKVSHDGCAPHQAD